MPDTYIHRQNGAATCAEVKENLSPVETFRHALGIAGADKVTFLSIVYLRHPSAQSISFSERVVLSAIIYRMKLNAGASQKWIAKFSTLDRRTVRKALTSLSDAKIICHRNDKTWTANDPTLYNNLAPIYARKKYKKSDRWIDNIKSFKCYSITPTRQLTLLQASIYWLLNHMMHRKKQNPFFQTKKGLAQLLGVSRYTVERLLATLESMQIIELKEQRKITEKGRSYVVGYNLTVKVGCHINRQGV